MIIIVSKNVIKEGKAEEFKALKGDNIQLFPRKYQ